MRVLLRFLGLFIVVIGCTTERPSPEKNYPQPRFEGLGSHVRKVSTENADAQKFFDQGLAFMFAFNHDEAIRSFQQAIAIDSMCAMAWWGISYANGPYINFPLMLPDKATAAWNALVQAQKHAHHATPVEQDLIKALGTRYVNPNPENRASLDSAYANAMREVWKKYPNDADIGALFVESAMDLRPWDQWDYEGTANPGTAEVVSTLESVIALAPSHPLALHLYIHAVEASTNPGRAAAAADKLRDLTPSLGHMVHMPSHIDVRTGKWDAAIAANQKAIASDSVYRTKAKVPPDFYNLYIAHNFHMMAFAGMMSGRSAQAIEAVDKFVRDIPEKFKTEWAPISDGFFAAPFEVRMRFGKWDEILALPEPAEIHPIARTLRHHARAVALASLGRIREAESERKAFEAAATKLPPDAAFGNNTGAGLINVARLHLEGELQIHMGQTAKGLAKLRAAVAAEDHLRYDEPPDWIVPIRHTLGAALMSAKMYAEAESVYRDDLRHIPDNGWGLYGLTRACRELGKTAEADSLEKEFARVWAHADMKITSSCMCLP